MPEHWSQQFSWCSSLSSAGLSFKTGQAEKTCGRPLFPVFTIPFLLLPWRICLVPHQNSYNGKNSTHRPKIIALVRNTRNPRLITMSILRLSPPSAHSIHRCNTCRTSPTRDIDFLRFTNTTTSRMVHFPTMANSHRPFEVKYGYTYPWRSFFFC